MNDLGTTRYLNTLVFAHGYAGITHKLHKKDSLREQTILVL